MFPGLRFLLSFFSFFPMAAIEDLWARFSLTEEEEEGVDAPQQREPLVFNLATHFFTKQVVNAEAMARTFKLL